MKIRDRYTGQVREPNLVKGSECGQGSPEAPRFVGSPDRVQISGRSVEIQKARNLALRAPDIRQDLVNDILGSIQRGKYDVSGVDVVPRMLRDHAADRWE